ncbi:hypothetical protein Pcinc_019333 [Petrolisthes cinctipes]|uniref:Uncharacterized protein n=1 Tax=Petrolisthes cinctipes TaxID=88211 RepID=A0AAE1KLB5_PETCI|nr:hypothetical protein Pcinc_019333 [Petrolisthes cinctipes]
MGEVHVRKTAKKLCKREIWEQWWSRWGLETVTRFRLVTLVGKELASVRGSVQHPIQIPSVEHVGFSPKSEVITSHKETSTKHLSKQEVNA